VEIPIQNQKSHQNSYQLKFEEISPKIPRMQILRKLAPQLPPIDSPPGPPGGQKHFWEVSGIYLSSSLKKYHQKF
jgi:hypothetical protein